LNNDLPLQEFILENITGIAKQHTFDSNEATEAYGATTFSPNIKLDGAVKVQNVAQLQDIVRCANKTLMLDLYPISTGNNWGYGSFTGKSEKKTLVLDLSPMNKITPTSKELGLITLQPGVTQGQLCEYLQQNDWDFITPTTGAGPTCSILSNALERGYGITAHTDHFGAVNSLKAVALHPEFDAAIIESAVSELDSSGTDFIDKTYKYGLGPYIEGLYTQSNLALVTEGTIRLASKSTHVCAFYLRCFEPEKLDDIVNCIREILLKCSYVPAINLMDKRRIVSMTEQNPNGPQAHKVMTNEQVDKFVKTEGHPEWLVLGSISGEYELVEATKKIVRRLTKGLGKLLFSDSAPLTVLKKGLSSSIAEKTRLTAIKQVEKLIQQIDSLDEGLNIVKGIPNQIAIPLAYWRNQYVKPDKSKTLNPAKDECGLFWYAPLIPMNANAINNFAKFVRTTTIEFGIEPFITFTNLRHDCIDSTVPIVFDKKSPESLRLAVECLDKLVSEGLSLGYVPYRINTNQQQTILDKNSPYWRTVDKIKEALDPNRILNGTRYNPR